MKIEAVCPACKRVNSFDDTLPFRAECEKCAADLHVCIACRFYDRYADNECREDQADPVPVKDRRNLCEYWKPIVIDASVGGSDAEARAKAKLAAAFGLQAPVAPCLSADDEAKRKLAELFKKK